MEFTKNKVWNVALMVALIDLGIIAIGSIIYHKDPYGILGVALVMSVVLFIQFVAGVIIAIPQKHRQIGQGILLGSLLILLGGLGICTFMMFGSIA